MTRPFVPTNDNCQMISHELTEGGDIYDLIDYGADGYAVTLRPEFAEVVGDYGSFTVLGTADGGASASATGSMRVGLNEYDCTLPTLVEGLVLAPVSATDVN